MHAARLIFPDRPEGVYAGPLAPSATEHVNPITSRLEHLRSMKYAARVAVLHGLCEVASEFRTCLDALKQDFKPVQFKVCNRVRVGPTPVKIFVPRIPDEAL